MNVGIFTDSYLPDINGVVTSIVTLKKALEQLGHTVFIVSNHIGTRILYDPEERILRLAGVELKHLYGYTMSSPLNFAREYLEEMDLDIIHTQHEFGVSLYGRMMGKELNIPVVYTYHTMYEDYTHYINPFDLNHIEKAGKWVVKSASRKLGNTVQAVIAPSEKTKETLYEYGVRAPIYVVPTGLDLDRFKLENLELEKIQNIREQLGFHEDTKTLVFVGRIAKEKSIEIPIEALSLLNDQDIHLIIVGAGTDEEYYQELTRKKELDHRVHFIGKIPSEQIPYYYAAFDGFVSASLTETQGLTYIEALASGLNIFGRRDEVLYDLIDEGNTGYYFDDAQELSQKIEHFFSLSREERQKKADLCREKTIPYAKELFGQKVIAVYEQVIDDYRLTFTVEKIRIQDDFVKLYLERESDEDTIKILIPLDDFFELKIGLHTKVDAYLVSGYLTMQEYYQAYSILKRRVFTKEQSVFELKQYAHHHFELDEAKLNQLIQEFQEKNWLNDQKYAYEKAEYWHDMGNSRRNIAAKLSKAGIARDLIDEVLQNLNTKKELANAQALAQRLIQTVKLQSSNMKRKNIIHKLIQKGYSSDIAQEVGEALELDDNDEEALQLTFKKAVRLYSSLPEEKRRQKIRQYCLRNGFSGQEIDEKLEMSEEFND